MNSASYHKAALLVAVALLACTPVLAVTVNPGSQQLSQPKEESYTYVYSVLNSDPQPRSLKLVLDPWSEYLTDRVTFSKQQFVLLPGQAENVQLTINPTGLGPETHTLKVGVFDAEQRLATFELLITMPGTPVERYTVSADAQDTTTERAVPVSVTLENFGNIIGYAQIVLSIWRGEEEIGTVQNPTTYQVLPGSKTSYDLLYTDTLEPGFYTARVEAVYPSQTVNATDQFSVRLDDVTERIDTGSDLILTFASLGNPQTVHYSLVDATGEERASGTAVPQAGDIVVQTRDLPAGEYDLVISIQSTQQHVTVSIRDRAAQSRLVLAGAVLVIALVALYSTRRRLWQAWRVRQLERAVEQRQAEVTKLINRAHRLVDRYTALHARRHHATEFSGSSSQGPR